MYSQSDGVPRSNMMAKFKANPRALLLGTDSFWQGVDVPGDALTNVIITKLPFSVPDRPLLEARLEAIRKPRGRAVYGISIARSGYEVEARLRPFDSQPARPRDGGDSRPARKNQAVRKVVLRIAAELPTSSRIVCTGINGIGLAVYVQP